MQVLGLFFKTWVLPLYVTALLRHTLAEPHEDGGNLGPGGVAGRVQVPVHAFHDALGHRPSHGGLGIVLDLSLIHIS